MKKSKVIIHNSSAKELNITNSKIKENSKLFFENNNIRNLSINNNNIRKESIIIFEDNNIYLERPNNSISNNSKLEIKKNTIQENSCIYIKKNKNIENFEISCSDILNSKIIVDEDSKIYENIMQGNLILNSQIIINSTKKMSFVSNKIENSNLKTKINTQEEDNDICDYITYIYNEIKNTNINILEKKLKSIVLQNNVFIEDINYEVNKKITNSNLITINTNIISELLHIEYNNNLKIFIDKLNNKSNKRLEINKINVNNNNNISIDFDNINKLFIDVEENSIKEIKFNEVILAKIKIKSNIEIEKLEISNIKSLYLNCNFNKIKIFENKNKNKIYEYDLSNSTIERGIELSEAEFECIPDLINTYSVNEISVSNVKINKKINYKDRDKLRKLKELAENNKDVEMAMHFNSLELENKEYKNKIEKIFNNEYKEISNYGQEIFKPIRYLIYWDIIFIFIYSLLIELKLNLDNFYLVIKFTLINNIPFIQIIRNPNKDFFNKFYTNFDSQGILAIPTLDGILIFFHLLISFGLIFLIGLGIRNKFRLK